MLRKTTRIALLSSVAVLAFGTAHAQSDNQPMGEIDEQSCVALAERLAEDTQVEVEVRTQIEDVIAKGDVTQCQIVFTAWDEQGALTGNSLELVATDQVTQRMIVQQEIEVDADVAVYQPPAEVEVDTGTPEVTWTMPRQNATINEQAPQIVVRQGRPTVKVEMPQPRITVMMPKPEITVTWPESTLDMSDIQPEISVRIPEPVVTVNMPDPVIELTIGGDGPKDLVELDDGRFAPQGATKQDLEPRISLQQTEATVTRGTDAEAPEIIFNRGEPQVSFEMEEPEVTVEVVGEPEIMVSSGGGEADIAIRENTSAPEQETDTSSKNKEVLNEDQQVDGQEKN